MDLIINPKGEIHATHEDVQNISPTIYGDGYSVVRVPDSAITITEEGKFELVSGTLDDYRLTIPVATIGGTKVPVDHLTFAVIREAVLNATALGETKVELSLTSGAVTGTLTEARAAMRLFIG